MDTIEIEVCRVDIASVSVLLLTRRRCGAFSTCWRADDPVRGSGLVAVGRTDMRKGMNGLALQVQLVLGRDPHAGDLYVFRGVRGDLIKICQRAPKFPQKWAVKIPWLGG